MLITSLSILLALIVSPTSAIVIATGESTSTNTNTTKQPSNSGDIASGDSGAGTNSTFYYEANTFLLNGQNQNTNKPSRSRTDAASPSMTSARNGRMLDLDALVGDFAASQAKRERSMSGNRQSRYLSTNSNSNQPTLDVGNGKKLHIQGFIPIVGVKDVTEDDESEQAAQSAGTADLPYGQSSIGHASFMTNGPTGTTTNIQRYLDQSAAQSQQVDAKFSGATVVESLKKPIKKLSGFVSGQGESSQQQQQQQQQQNCLCVPFYMCKNGYISESSLGKTQLQQMIIQQQQLASQSNQMLEMKSGQLMATNSNQKPINEPQKEAQYADSYVPVDERSLDREIITMAPMVGNFDINSELQAMNKTDQANGAYVTGAMSVDQADQLSNLSLADSASSDYSQDILGRMLGLGKSGIGKASLPASGANGGVCGLLRTCCNIPLHLYPSQQDLANERLMAQAASSNANSNQQIQRFQANKQALMPMMSQLEQAMQFQQQQQPQVIVGQRYGPSAGPVGVNQQLQVQRNNQLLPYGLPSTTTTANNNQQLAAMAHRSNQFQQQQQQQQQPLSTNRYQQQYPLVQPQQFMRGSPSQVQPLQSFQQLQALAYQQQVRGPPVPAAAAAAAAAVASGLAAQASSQVSRALPAGTRKILDGRCGIRQAAGITGRVQNLHYPDSSADFGEYPAQAAILKRLQGADSLFVCAGTLISQYWVATAAHCIKKHAQGELKVRLGEWDVHRDDEFYPHVEKEVRDLVVHPEFVAGNLINDIALLRLDSPVDPSLPHVSPACLPSIDESFSHQRCWVTGWGKDSFGQRGSFQAVLREVELPVVGQGECESALRQTRLGPHYRLHSGFICAGGEGGRDACEGDGGSGLYCVQPDGLIKVAGLVSWGIGCGQPGVPGVYVSLAHYRPWIENIISIDEDIYSPHQNMLGVGPNSLVSERSKLGAANNETAAADPTMAMTMTTTTTTTTTATPPITTTMAPQQVSDD